MSDNSNSGIGFLGLLTIAFIVLKLCHVITWSWWWVLAPIWGGILIVLSIIVVPFGISLLLVAVLAIKEVCKKK